MAEKIEQPDQEPVGVPTDDSEPAPVKAKSSRKAFSSARRELSDQNLLLLQCRNSYLTRLIALKKRTPNWQRIARDFTKPIGVITDSPGAGRGCWTRDYADLGRQQQNRMVLICGTISPLSSYY